MFNLFKKKPPTIYKRIDSQLLVFRSMTGFLPDIVYLGRKEYAELMTTKGSDGVYLFNLITRMIVFHHKNIKVFAINSSSHLSVGM